MSSSRHLTPWPHLLFDIIAPLIPLVYLLCLLPPRDPQVENVSSMGAGLRLAHCQVPSFGTQLLPSSSPAATVPTLLQTLISHQAPPLVSPLVSSPPSPIVYKAVRMDACLKPESDHSIHSLKMLPYPGHLRGKIHTPEREVQSPSWCGSSLLHVPRTCLTSMGPSISASPRPVT